MSERIDVQAGTTIVGAGGDAVREEGPALTQWVDAAPAGTRGHYARCVRLLARLRLLASQDAGAPLPPGAAGEMAHAARAIVAEADAAGHDVLAAVAERSRRSAAVFLGPRQARLAAAAAEHRRGGRGRERRGAVAAPAPVRGADLGAVDGAARDLRPRRSPLPACTSCGTGCPEG